MASPSSGEDLVYAQQASELRMLFPDMPVEIVYSILAKFFGQ
jgi:hypothetical protein